MMMMMMMMMMMSLFQVAERIETSNKPHKTLGYSPLLLLQLPPKDCSCTCW